jgi:YidC/Oxa1 family membrane protein insertase
MGMDKNTLIGFGLIAALLIAMFAINSKSRLATEGEKKRIADSVAAVKAKLDSNTALLNKAVVDTNKQTYTTSASSPFQQPNATETFTELQNDLMIVRFSNKGGQPVKVTLKKFKTADSKEVVLQNSPFNRFSYSFNSEDNKTEESANIYFSAGNVVVNADKTQSLSFTAADSTGKKMVHQYSIKPADYMLDLNLSVNGVAKLFTQNTVKFLWQAEASKIEKDQKYEATQTNICYSEAGDFDFEHLGSGDNVKFKKPVEWLAVKQQFFASALVSKNKFNTSEVTWTVPEDTGKYITRVVSNATMVLPASENTIIPLQMYFGPSDYHILKQYNNSMENIVPYGSGVFAFVKYINRYFLLPVFDFLRGNVASMGIVILLLTLLIRLITSPILYKSYLSGAKMKVLKPEVDALKEKFKDDQQAFGMEQMKLWRSAGVSPLGGCLPAILQIPIFMSLYYFFQSNIDLRGKNFLWADDLAQYDSILQIPFDVPFYGDHVSLFTITATLTSLLISVYSMSNMQDNSNPVMKYMPYIFPVFLLFVFNTLPSALTWYYTVSNTITLVLQIVIQKYIINHDKILAQINENRKKPVKKSKLQAKVEAMQDSQKKIQEMKNKNTKK